MEQHGATCWIDFWTNQIQPMATSCGGSNESRPDVSHWCILTHYQQLSDFALTLTRYYSPLLNHNLKSARELSTVTLLMRRTASQSEGVSLAKLVLHITEAECCFWQMMWTRCKHDEMKRKYPKDKLTANRLDLFIYLFVLMLVGLISPVDFVAWFVSFVLVLEIYTVHMSSKNEMFLKITFNIIFP